MRRDRKDTLCRVHIRIHVVWSYFLLLTTAVAALQHTRLDWLDQYNSKFLAKVEGKAGLALPLSE